jgi:hypothetical protein
MGSKKGDYEVGYRKPPLHSRFPKGKSGNPSGKRARDPSMAELMRTELNKKILITENGKARRITKLQAMVMKSVQQAIQGDPRAHKQVMEALHDPGSFTHLDDIPMEFTLKLEEDDRDVSE